MAAQSQITRLTALVLSTGLVTMGTIGGAAFYVGGAIKSTGNISGSGSIIISNDFQTADEDFCISVAGQEEMDCMSTVDLTVTGSNLGTTFAKTSVGADGMARADIVHKVNPLTSSGIITRSEIHMQGSPDDFYVDCGFRKAAEDGTGTSLTNNLLISGTGSYAVVMTGSVITWNGADRFDCGTLSNSGTFQAGSELKLWYHNITGE